VASTRAARVEPSDSWSQKLPASHVWPDRAPPTVFGIGTAFSKPMLFGAGVLVVQVRAPTM
jgi:hypothetical protein